MIAFLRHLFLHDALLKLFSLALAILIWLTINFAIGRNEDRPAVPVPSFVPHPVQQASFVLPVMVLSPGDNPREIKMDPKEVEVTVEGDPKVIRALQKNDLRAIVDLSGIESAQGLVKRIELSKPAGVSELRTVPSEVKLTVLAAAPKTAAGIDEKTKTP
jgi:YbbR domain-containing protein